MPKYVIMLAALGWAVLPLCVYAQPSARAEGGILGVVALGGLKDTEGAGLTTHMQGLSVRGMYALYPSVAVGAEGQFLQGRPNQVLFLQDFQEQTFSAVVKWVVTPHTRPAFYLLAGAGILEQSYQVALSEKQRFRTAAYSGGVGVEISLGGGIYGQAEYRLRRGQGSAGAALVRWEKIRREWHLGVSWKL